MPVAGPQTPMTDGCPKRLEANQGGGIWRGLVGCEGQSRAMWSLLQLSTFQEILPRAQGWNSGVYELDGENMSTPFLCKMYCSLSNEWRQQSSKAWHCVQVV